MVARQLSRFNVWASAPAAEGLSPGWGSRELRRATLTLSVTQVVSWGVLFYGFAVMAPIITAETGWGGPVVSGAFTLGLLVSGFAAPSVARALNGHDPRTVLTAGSVLGAVGMLGFAVASHPVVLYLAWTVIGIAMAATLYEPAMAVLVALDPTRRNRTLTVVAIAGGLASTVFAPLAGFLVQWLGWRQAVACLGIGGGVVTVVLHGLVLPPAHAHPIEARVLPEPAPRFDRPLRRLRIALLFEQAAIVATTTHLVGLLADRAVRVPTAAALLGFIGIGKLAGRLLILRGGEWRRLVDFAIGANLLQFAGLAAPLLATGNVVLLAAMVVVGAGSGATTVVRPLLLIDLVGAGPFAATSARLQRATTAARAGAPFALACGVAAVGWSLAWAIAVSSFLVAAGSYFSLHSAPPPTNVNLTRPGRPQPGTPEEEPASLYDGP